MKPTSTLNDSSLRDRQKNYQGYISKTRTIPKITYCNPPFFKPYRVLPGIRKTKVGTLNEGLFKLFCWKAKILNARATVFLELRAPKRDVVYTGSHEVFGKLFLMLEHRSCFFL
ncbi:hypothetical protein MAR_017925 [Mya arenaria]|uniref:Uncharacterized protein n=1 Tax=Mya arenaria TaxID=6604 RepID=A0ABY7EGB2_MYAAR|nr:hypothetical protein MAR_017925 [Mya arenaria]